MVEVEVMVQGQKQLPRQLRSLYITNNRGRDPGGGRRRGPEYEQQREVVHSREGTVGETATDMFMRSLSS